MLKIHAKLQHDFSVVCSALPAEQPRGYCSEKVWPQGIGLWETAFCQHCCSQSSLLCQPPENVPSTEPLVCFLTCTQPLIPKGRLYECHNLCPSQGLFSHKDLMQMADVRDERGTAAAH